MVHCIQPPKRKCISQLVRFAVDIRARSVPEMKRFSLNDGRNIKPCRSLVPQQLCSIVLGLPVAIVMEAIVVMFYRCTRFQKLPMVVRRITAPSHHDYYS